MPDSEGSFSIKDLADILARTLGLSPGDTVELQRDRLNPNRVLLVRLPCTALASSESSPDQG